MDPTVVAIPGYFGSMGAEYLYLKRRAEQQGPSAADYERNDTITSLAMGVASLIAPLVMPKVLGPVTPGAGRFGKALVGVAAGAVAVTTVADRLAKLDDAPGPSATATTADAPGDNPNRRRRRRIAEAARKVAKVGGVASIVAGGVAITSTWTHRTNAGRLWERRVLPDLGNGPLALLAAVIGWDFIYYWNHRFMHETRWLWAIHVVHHSSEHYNLSTALRQPVLDVVGMFVPYGLLSAAGFRPATIETARGVNLLYQYWIHTETIPKLGPIEEVFNTASHHRVHHGSNRQYLDRNHGSILIVWDRLFGTFEREDEPVRYGLTKNIETFNPLRIATHEHEDILRDVAASSSWWERLQFVFRGPGWAYDAHRRGLGAPHPVAEEAHHEPAEPDPTPVGAA